MRPRPDRELIGAGAQDPDPRPWLRILALGGLVGPVTFIVTWALVGSSASGYSSTEDAISRLAESGETTQVAMTIGFVVYGVGVLGFGLALRDSLPGGAGIAAMVTGASTLGVAAFPLGSPTADRVHAVFAGVGYCALALTPLLAAGPLARDGRARWAWASRGTAFAVAGCLVLSTLGARHGLWQRAGLTIGDAWIMFGALAHLRSAGGRRRSRVEFDPRSSPR